MSALDLRGISVYIEKEVHPTYEGLVSRSSENVQDRPFGTMKDLFVTAACVGAQRNLYEPLGSSREIFSGETFNAKTDVPVLAALAYQRTESLDVVSDPKQVVEIAQGWANAGIHILQREELLTRQGLRPLFKLVDLVLDQPLIKK